MTDDSHPLPADSAGQPWTGRHFSENTFGSDDGSAPQGFLDAIAAFRQGTAGAAEVVDSLREVRLLVPLLASLAEEGINDDGRKVDKSAELSIVTVAGPDGRDVLPAFSSVRSMSAWNPQARPVPVDAVRVALAAAGENTEIVVIDPGAVTEFALRRPAISAIAQSLPYQPGFSDPEVLAELNRLVAVEAAVVSVRVLPGDPEARLRGPELIVELALIPGLDRSALDSVLERFQQGLGASEVVANRVDSMALRLVAAG